MLEKNAAFFSLFCSRTFFVGLMTRGIRRVNDIPVTYLCASPSHRSDRCHSSIRASPIIINTGVLPLGNFSSAFLFV